MIPIIPIDIPDTSKADHSWPWPDYMALYYETEYLRLKWAETLRELMETKILLEEVTDRAVRAEQQLAMIERDLPNYYSEVKKQALANLAVEDESP